MSDDLDSLGDSLFNGFLPTLWKKLCPDTQKPLGSWVIHYTKRHEQYEQWINKGEPPCLWLSGLHIPESYLTALVQTTCRMRSWPLDKSTLYTVVTKYTSDKDLTRLESGKSMIFHSILVLLSSFKSTITMFDSFSYSYFIFTFTYSLIKNTSHRYLFSSSFESFFLWVEISLYYATDFYSWFCSY